MSHLALNHLSLADGERGAGDGGLANGSALEALREILKIYDYTDSPATRQRIAGLVGLRRLGKRHVAAGAASSEL